MKKNIVLGIALMLSVAVCASDKPEWVQRLLQCEIIDSVVDANDASLRGSDATVWYLYYHQPVCHAIPGGERFPLRCAMVVRDDPYTCCNQMYVRGYELDGLWKKAGLSLKSPICSDIAQRYHGNVFLPEHRYFSFSSPVNCWEKLDYCNASESAQDFHALLESLKTVFKGKWAMTGVSKGGISTVMQHAFFPDDADLYVPNSAPFCNGISDKRLYHYIVNNGWTSSTRRRVNAFMRELMENSEAATYFAGMSKLQFPNISDESARMLYYFEISNMQFSAHVGIPGSTIDSIMNHNEAMLQSILNQHVDSLNHTFLMAHMVDDGSLDATPAWKAYLPEGFKAKGANECQDAVVTKDEWCSSSNSAYTYQSLHELGNYDCDIRYLYNDTLAPEVCNDMAKQHFADSLQNFYESVPNVQYLFSPFFKDVKYDNHELFDMVEQKTKNATKTIIFLYGEDDAWTGAAMNDEFINGNNVRKYICRNQAHTVLLDKASAAQQNEIWSLIDEVMLSPTKITETENGLGRSAYGKFLRDGKLVILKGGKQYNAIGQQI